MLLLGGECINNLLKRMALQLLLIFTFVFPSTYSLGEKQYVKIGFHWYNKNMDDLGDKILPTRLIIRKTDKSAVTNDEIIKLGIDSKGFLIHSKSLLNQSNGKVKNAIIMHELDVTYLESEKLLKRNNGSLRDLLEK